MRWHRASDLAAYRGDLLRAVRRQWRIEETRRRLADPTPIPVRWRRVPAGLAVQDHAINVFGAAERDAATPGSGTIDDLAALLRGLPSMRLVILGEPGAGKTTAAIRLLLDLTAEPRAGEPVPVLVSIGSWQPHRQDLRRWLAGALAADFPALGSATTDGSTIATALLDEGSLLPIIDGLDELPAAARSTAIVAINAALHRGDSLVLTCRTSEYVAAVGDADTVTAAAVVQLQPLGLPALTAYLPRTAKPRPDLSTTWDEPLATLRRQADRQLLRVLRTPLMTSLAREAYSDTGADPAELLDEQRFARAEDIEAHLLDRALPTAYREAGDRVARWFATLAGMLDRGGTYDVAWWRLFRSGSRGINAAAGAAVGAVAAAVLSAAAVPRALLDVAFTLAAAAVGALIGVRQPATPSTVRLSLSAGLRRWRPGAMTARPRLRIGAAGWLAGLVAVVVLVGVRAGWTAALVGAAAVGVVRALDAWLDVPADLGVVASPISLLRSDRTAALTRAVLRGALLGTVAGLLTGPELAAAVGVAAFVASAGLTAWWRFTFARLAYALAGRLPFRLMAFLDDAAVRGVLRQVGSVYQFRHARLQDRLAGRRLSADDTAAVPPLDDDVPESSTPFPATGPVVVILTALEVEYQAVVAHLLDVRTVVHEAGTLFEVGMLAGCSRRVAVAVVGEGNQTTAVVTERAAALLQPDVVLFSGIAGALQGDIQLGDVVVGTRVYSYHSGKATSDGFAARPRAWDAPHRLEQRARHVSRNGGWHRLLPDPARPPVVHFKPIAAGEVVLADRDSAHAALLRRHYDDAAVVEMESAGLARAAHLRGDLPALVIRGVSDRADEGKTAADRAGWQRTAAANAAAFALGLVIELPAEV
ncbi:NACHT domain-containing protein [Actinoplanes sp. NPDC051411]|uniref:phosphorylase family protein n=1 Tax=Actinoplanes sp. NPDC051411 TaxID=3155522 RepID=UPI00341C6180